MCHYCPQVKVFPKVSVGDRDIFKLSKLTLWTLPVYQFYKIFTEK